MHESPDSLDLELTGTDVEGPRQQISACGRFRPEVD